MRIPGKSFIWEVVPGSPGSWAEGKAARAGNVCMELLQWVLETCSTGDLWGQCGTSASGYPTRGVMELEYDLLTTVSHWLRAPPSGCQTPGIMDWCAVLVVEWASGSGKDLRENDMGKPWSQISVKTHDYGNGSNNRRLFFIKTNFYHLGNTRGKKLLLVVDLSSWNFYAQPVRNSHMFELLSLIHQSLNLWCVFLIISSWLSLNLDFYLAIFKCIFPLPYFLRLHIHLSVLSSWFLILSFHNGRPKNRLLPQNFIKFYTYNSLVIILVFFIIIWSTSISF